MTLKLFNTLTRKKEIFKPIKDKIVKKWQKKWEEKQTFKVKEDENGRFK